MMKILTILISIACAFACPISVLAALSSTGVTCSDIEIFSQDDHGNSSFQATEYDIEVYPSTVGKYGYEARISSSQGISLEQDVKVNILKAPSADLASLEEIAKLVTPNINFDEIATVVHGNVGVKANADDSAGIGIFEMQDKNGTVLGKLVQLGWSFGRCR